jgi:putative transposase
MVTIMNRFILRERTPLWLMVYGVYLYFGSMSLRHAARALEPLIARSHVALWLWVQRLGHMAEMFRVDRRSVECFFVDETMIQHGPVKVWLWIAFDPGTRKYLGFHVSATQNALAAWIFLKRLRGRYGRKPLYTDGGSWYPLAAKWARLNHTVYGEDLKALMERYVEAVKDRVECFDDCFPCRRLEDCDLSHIHNWLSVFTLMYNIIHRPARFYTPASKT